MVVAVVMQLHDLHHPHPRLNPVSFPVSLFADFSLENPAVIIFKTSPFVRIIKPVSDIVECPGSFSCKQIPP